jgi:hypothetical protein
MNPDDSHSGEVNHNHIDASLTYRRVKSELCIIRIKEALNELS